MSARHLQPIGPEGLPEYPLPRDLRLPTHFFLPLQFNRWLNSSLHLRGGYDVQGVAFALLCLSQNQAPVGTLPCDHELLARMLRLPTGQFDHMMRADVTPLHGWSRYDCEGEVRYGHPVVIEVLGDVINRRVARQASNEARARDKRIERLVVALRGIGIDERALANRAAIEAIEDHLTRTCQGNRTITTYMAAVRWANAEGVWRLGK